MRRKQLGCRITALVGCALAAIGQVHAQPAYPAKPLRMLVGFPPGGSTDVLARQIGIKLSEALGQQIVIDNRPGASGNLASEWVAKGVPDGYTLMMATVASHAINPAVYRKLPFDPIRDLQPITLVATYPLLLTINPTVNARTVKDLIALAKSKPGQLRVASSGSGSPGHLSAEIFKAAAGIDLLHVPYKGGAPANMAVLSGEAHVTFATLPGMMPFVKAGRVTAAAVTTAKRSPALPDVPSIAESGLAGFDVSSWAGVVAPAKTPRPVVTKLNDEIRRVLQAKDMRDRLAAEGANPVGSTPEEFAAFLKMEVAQWGTAVKTAGAQID
jgi:tripartite-type tricarboxylate transporter receptor subunit TctC